MESHVDQYKYLINQKCDSAFADGMKELLLDCNKNKSVSLTSKPSLFNFIEKYLDVPFEQLLQEVFPDGNRLIFNSLKLSDIGRTSIKGEKIKFNDALSVQQSIRDWASKIQFYRKSSMASCNHEVRDKFRMTLGTLELLLLYFSDVFLPKKASLQISQRQQDGKSSTSKYEKTHQQYCKLCWRNTIKYTAEKNTHGQVRTISKTRLSDNYCSYHNPSNSESKINYVRDLRYKEKYQHEVDVLNRKKNRETKQLLKSNFYPSSKWYQYNCDFRLFNCEIRKLAYLLAHSKLDTPIRKKIIQLKEQGKSTQEIANSVGISRQAALKNLKYIERKQKEILRNVYVKQKDQQELEENHILHMPQYSRMFTNNIDYTIKKNKERLSEEVRRLLGENF